MASWLIWSPNIWSRSVPNQLIQTSLGLIAIGIDVTATVFLNLPSWAFILGLVCFSLMAVFLRFRNVREVRPQNSSPITRRTTLVWCKQQELSYQQMMNLRTHHVSICFRYVQIYCGGCRCSDSWHFSPLHFPAARQYRSRPVPPQAGLGFHDIS